MRAYRVGEAASQVTVEMVKANSRIAHDDEDLMIQSLIDAAHERAERETGIVYGSGEWIIEADITAEKLLLPIWPVTAWPAGWTAESVGRDLILVAGEWPADRRITVTAGMPMPATVKQAILMMVGYWFDQRNTATEAGAREVPYGASDLLALERRMFA